MRSPLALIIIVCLTRVCLRDAKNVCHVARRDAGSYDGNLANDHTVFFFFGNIYHNRLRYSRRRGLFVSLNVGKDGYNENLMIYEFCEFIILFFHAVAT